MYLFLPILRHVTATKLWILDFFLYNSFDVDGKIPVSRNT
jgi:hypothetical protein